MAKLTTPTIPAELAPLVGDYTCTTDKCLYRVGYAAGSLTLSRCCTCGPDPAADVFSTAYPITEKDLLRLVSYGSFYATNF